MVRIIVDKLPESCNADDCIFRTDKWCPILIAKSRDTGKELGTFVANYGYDKVRCPHCPLEESK